MKKIHIFPRNFVLFFLVTDWSTGTPTKKQNVVVQSFEQIAPIQTHPQIPMQPQKPDLVQQHLQSMPVKPHEPSIPAQFQNLQHNNQQHILPLNYYQQNSTSNHSHYQPLPGPVPQNHSPENHSPKNHPPLNHPPQNHPPQNRPPQNHPPLNRPPQNHPPQQQQEPKIEYDSQLKQPFNNINAVPLPYMKYDKDENPVLHYGHDNLDTEFGDRKANPDEFPYFVQVLRTGEVCGGALIRSPISGRPVVLTAMHCLVEADTTKMLQPHEITLRVGVSSVNDYEQERKGAVLLAHSNYTLFGPSKYPAFNDIGMIITDSDFELTQHAKFIDLPEQNLPTIWHEITIKGFGRGREAGHDGHPTHMRTNTVPTWFNEECDNAYFKESGAHLITDGHFCASHRTGGLDTCQGDSGSPATTNEKGKTFLVGLVSWGKGCGRIKYPGVYVRVWHHLPWIKKTLYDYEKNCIIPPFPKYPQ